MKRRLLSGGVWTVATKIVAGASGFAVNAVLARLLAPEDLGAYFLLVSAASVGAMMSQLGMQVALVRLVSEALAQGNGARARGYIRSALCVVAVAATGLGVLMAWSGGEMALRIFHSAALAEIAWLGGAWLAGLAVTNLVAEAFRGLHDYRVAGVLSGAGSNLLMLATLGLIVPIWDRAGLLLVTGLGAAAVILSAVAGLVMLRRRTSHFGPADTVSVRQMLAVSLPLLVTSLAIFVSTHADLWILGMYRSPDEVGIYGAAVRLVQLVLMPMLMMNAILAPAISEQFSQGHRVRLERLLRGSAALAGLPALGALIVIGLAASPLLGWIYGDAYRSGATALLWVSAGQVANVLCGSAAVVLMMTGHQRAAMVISVLTGAGLIAGGMLTVDRYGMNGVAAVTGLMTAAHGLLCAVWVNRVLGIRTYCDWLGIADVAARVRLALRTGGNDSGS
ncbi:MAG: lipopolysaccharide biosynthesis protein [Burkholderiales bacterium]